MNFRSVVIALIALGIFIVSSSAFYVVDETQQVIITQFGQPIGEAIAEPGVHMKVPFIQVANFFDKRFLEWDGLANQVPTRDKRFIWVDTYARWRISDPLLFFQRLRDERGAQTRLDDILDGETRNSIANHDLVEVIRASNRVPQQDDELPDDATAMLAEIETGRGAIQEQILKNAQARTTELGIEILDVRLKRINYVDEVREKVYARMIAERKRIATRYRSEGDGEASRIRGEKERDLKEIESEAYRQAQEIKGRADAEATRTYAAAYNQSSDARRFYEFTKTMDTFRSTVDSDTTFLLSTDGDFYKYMEDATP